MGALLKVKGQSPTYPSARSFPLCLLQALIAVCRFNDNAICFKRSGGLSHQPMPARSTQKQYIHQVSPHPILNRSQRIESRCSFLDSRQKTRVALPKRETRMRGVVTQNIKPLKRNPNWVLVNLQFAHSLSCDKIAIPHFSPESQQSVVVHCPPLRTKEPATTWRDLL